MKKETWILIALLGYGLYKYYADRQVEESPKQLTEEDLNKIIREIHEASKGDTTKIIPAIAERLQIEVNKANEMYEIWVQKYLSNQ